jgi:hypothetical protein
MLSGDRFWWAMPTLRILWLRHASYQKSNMSSILSQLNGKLILAILTFNFH